MSEWLSLMKMDTITLIPEDCNPEEVQNLADVGWFAILVAGKLYKDYEDSLKETGDFRTNIEADIRNAYFENGLEDRLEWDFAVRLTWLCYQAKVVKPKRKTLPSVEGQKCWCGEDAEVLDHLWPLSHGGPAHPSNSKEGRQTDHSWNFMATCKFHNGQKSATPMLIYRPGFLADLREYVFRVTW